MSSAAAKGARLLPQGAESGQRHIKVRFYDGGYLLEHCEEEPCDVSEAGVATCGRLACPSCARGSGNLSAWQLDELWPGDPIVCDCGHAWIPAGPIGRQADEADRSNEQSQASARSQTRTA